MGPSSFIGCKTPVEDSPCVTNNIFGLTSSTAFSTSFALKFVPGAVSFCVTFAPEKIIHEYYEVIGAA